MQGTRQVTSQAQLARHQGAAFSPSHVTATRPEAPLAAAVHCRCLEAPRSQLCSVSRAKQGLRRRAWQVSKAQLA